MLSKALLGLASPLNCVRQFQKSVGLHVHCITYSLSYCTHSDKNGPPTSDVTHVLSH